MSTKKKTTEKPAKKKRTIEEIKGFDENIDLETFEVDGSKESTTRLNQLYPMGKSRDIKELPTEASMLIKQCEKATESIKEISFIKQSAINKLKKILGENEYGEIDNNLVSWSNVNKESIDINKFKKEKPELCFKYLRNSSHRRFNIKKVENLLLRR